MAKNIISKCLAKKTQPKKVTSSKPKDLVINEWMSGNHKQNNQDSIVCPPIFEDEFQPQGKVIDTKNPRMDTGLLKMRIADKIKTYNKDS